MYILQDNNILLFFILHLVLAFFVFMISCRGSNGVDRFGVWVVALSYVLIVFTRQGLGVDETTYRDAYDIYLTNPSAVEFEYAFKFLFYCFKMFSIAPENFNNLICCIYILLITLVILFSVHSPYKSLCLLLFLFSSVSLDFIFNAYRQGFAFIFLFSSLLAYQAGKKKSSLVFMGIAIGFHWSSILIPLLLLSFRLIPKKKVSIILIGMTFLTLLGFVIPLGILPTLKMILSSIPFKNYYFDKISFYLTTSESSIYDLNFFGRLPLLANTLLLLVVTWYFRKYIDYIWIKLVTAVGLYCLIFMEMSFSFRNYYWLLPLLPFIACNILTTYRDLGKKDSAQYVAMILLGHIFLSFVTYYTSPLIPFVFMS